MSYPRSGTTWLRFLLAETLTGVTTEFNPETNLVPYIGSHIHARGILPDGGRLIFSHETRVMRNHRIIYIVRDPRAVALSLHRWLYRRQLVSADFDQFLERFVTGRADPWGPWDRHVNLWLSMEPARQEHVHIVRFETLRQETIRTLTEALRFLGAQIDDNAIARAVQDNSLERMREKEEAAPDSSFEKGIRRDVPFVASGETEGWRRQLTPHQRKRIEDAFRETMRRLGYALSKSSNNEGINR